MVLRAKIKELLQVKKLTKLQEINSKLNMYELEKGELILNSYPRRLVLELTTKCSYKCKMCVDRDNNFNLIDLDFFGSLLNKIDEILPFITEICLFGFGEPSLHSDFEYILFWLNKHYPNIQKYFVTNGKNLSKIKNSIFENKVDIMAISLDGSNPETNNNIRIGSDFDKIIYDLKNIVKYKNDNKLNYPYMNFVFVAMNSNIEELPKMVELTKDVGLEELKVVYLTIFNEGLLNESLYNQKDRVEKIFKESELKAKELNIKLKLPYIQGADIAIDKYHKECYTSYRDLFISADGYIRPCMSSNLNFGHVKEYNNFDSLWNSKYFREFRKNVNINVECLQPCKKCYQSSHSNVNQEWAWNQIDENYLFDWSNK